MALTRLEPTCALVVIDLQKGILSLPAMQAASEIIGRSAQLARAFRKRGQPVVLVNVSGRPPGRTDVERSRFSLTPEAIELIPELEQQPGDYLITKQRMGAFHGTALDDILRGRGVTQLFLTGVATSLGVESTARSAYDLGYHVVFVVDAITDLSDEAHRHSLERIFPRLGETETTDQVLKMLEATGS